MTYQPTKTELLELDFSLVDEYRRGSFHASHESGITHDKMGRQRTWFKDGVEINVASREDLIRILTPQ